MCGLHEVDPQGSTEPLSGSDAGDTGQEAGEASMDNLFPTMKQRQSLPHYRDGSEQPNWRIPT